MRPNAKVHPTKRPLPGRPPPIPPKLPPHGAGPAQRLSEGAWRSPSGVWHRTRSPTVPSLHRPKQSGGPKPSLSHGTPTGHRLAIIDQRLTATGGATDTECHREGRMQAFQWWWRPLGRQRGGRVGGRGSPSGLELDPSQDLLRMSFRAVNRESNVRECARGPTPRSTSQGPAAQCSPAAGLCFVGGGGEPRPMGN